MKAFLDTCVFDWFLADPNGPALYAMFRSGQLAGVVFPEVSLEIHAVPDVKADKREQLLTLVRPFFPVQPTHIPVLGIARLGAMRRAPRDATTLRERLKQIGLHKLDLLHVINAHYERCDVFVTNDKEDILKRKHVLEPLLGFEIVTPAELYARSVAT